MGAGGARLQQCLFDCTVLRGSLVFAPGATGFLGAAFGLFEERGKDTGEGHHQGDDKEDKTHCAPERGVAGRTRLLSDVGVGDPTGDQCEEGQCCSENEEVASHGALYSFSGFAKNCSTSPISWVSRYAGRLSRKMRP